MGLVLCLPASCNFVWLWKMEGTREASLTNLGLTGADVSLLHGEKLLLLPPSVRRRVNDANIADASVQADHTGLYLDFPHLWFHQKMFLVQV